MILAIGSFDGYHLGHQALFSHAKKLAEKVGDDWYPLTFYPHPKLFTRHDAKLLFSEEEKKLLRGGLGIPEPFVLPFTNELRSLEPEDFLRNIGLRFGATHLVVGHDFKFGLNRRGDTKMLQDWCAAQGGEAIVMPPLEVDGRRVSSSAIRERIASGDVSGGSKLLGYPWFVSGTVVKGCHRGSTLGFPTANLIMTGQKILPADGVYASAVFVEGEWHAAATSWGVNLTFGELGPRVMETTLLGWKGNLYHKPMQVALLEYLRPMLKFSSVQNLRETVACNCHSALGIFDENKEKLLRW